MAGEGFANSLPVGGGGKRKHKTLSIQEKVELVEKLDAGLPVKYLCEIYGVGSSTIYDLKKNKEKLLKFYAESYSKEGMANRKTMKEGKSSDLDQILMQWFRLGRTEGLHITGQMLMEQAKLFHAELGLNYDCDYSQGWLHKFKKRHGIRLYSVSDENAPSTLQNSWHKLLTSSFDNTDNTYTVFGETHETKMVHYLLDYAKKINNPEAKDVFVEDKKEEMEMDKNSPVLHQFSDEEIVQMVTNPSKHREHENDDKEDEEEMVEEKISINRCIHLATELIAGLEQWNFFTEQEIMNIYMLRTKLIKEKFEYMKQKSLEELFKKIMERGKQDSTDSHNNPITSTSTNLNSKIPTNKNSKQKSAHPYSRKAKQMVRNIHREEKLDKRKEQKNIKLQIIGEKCQWFQENIDAEKSELSNQDVLELIEKYLHRFDEELEQLDIVHNIKGRKQNQHASREDVIKMQKERDELEFTTCGLEIPDILDKANLEYLRNWTGELNKLPNIKFKKFQRIKLECTE